MNSVEAAWDEYRGWAKRSRTLQASVAFWNRIAAACAVLAAVFGAAAAGRTGIGATILSLAATVAAAMVPLFGRHLLESQDEAQWI